jgi:tRNA (guanosine-2'-O-)-methyltransferase
MRKVLEQRQPDFTIVIENVWDPHNVSAILRTADAVGVMTVHLVYTIEPFPDLVKRGKQSSASAKKWLDLRMHDSIKSCYEELRKEGFRIYASHLTRESVPLYEIPSCSPVALVLGNENRGVSDEACTLADAVYSIPMTGMVQSLNVSVAAAVSMYEVFRQRWMSGVYAAPRMEAGALDDLLENWARR